MAANVRDEELRALRHNDHRSAFEDYRKGRRHASDKAAFLREWLTLGPSDHLLECGSSSGKTSIDLARHAGCRVTGVDFQDEAIEVSRSMLALHFPELAGQCRFVNADLRSMDFDSDITKVLMPDFTEHVPDDILGQILENIGHKLPNCLLYVYTPERAHLFEVLKHHRILLRNPPGHINVKTSEQLQELLRRHGWRPVSIDWRSSHLPLLRDIERTLGRLPRLGRVFRRRIAIIAEWSARP